jgi:DNA-nicking Smr family endonuclease
MNGDNEQEFSAAMSDVVPLQREPRAGLTHKSHADKDVSLEHRRRAAEQLPEVDQNRLTANVIEPLDAWFVLSFKRPGVQNGVFRKLKQGRYEIQARLDLHRMTVDAARREIFEFIVESQQLGLRSVLLIHGKGESKAEQERGSIQSGSIQSGSILKGCVNHWLRELEIVQAFHSAQPQHGGTGAAYVLLRKSEEKKRENREKFSKGRIPYDAGS